MKREYYVQLYANKSNNFNEIDKFLKKLKLPKIIPEEKDK